PRFGLLCVFMKVQNRSNALGSYADRARDASLRIAHRETDRVRSRADEHRPCVALPVDVDGAHAVFLFQIQGLRGLAIRDRDRERTTEVTIGEVRERDRRISGHELDRPVLVVFRERDLSGPYELLDDIEWIVSQLRLGDLLHDGLEALGGDADR